MATINYKQLSTPEANLIELLSAQNQDGTYSAKLMGSEPFSVLAAKTIYNTYNDIESNMAADVEGPASSTDNALARFDGTTGKLIQNSNAILTDAGALSLASNLTVSGTGTSTLAGQVTSFANAGTASNLGSFVASNATLNSFTSYSPSASLDQKYWTLQAGTAVGDGVIRLRALNDAGTNGTNALIITRTGISSTAVEVGGNLTVSGGTATITGSAPALALKRSSDNSLVGYIDATTTGTLRLYGGVGGSNTLAASFPQTGNVLIGTTTDGGQKLQVNGDATFAGTVTASGNISSNAVFGSSSGTLYLRPNGISVASGQATIDTSGNATFAGKTYTAAGAAATPAISFSGDTDSGFYNAGGNQVALACGGGQIWNTTVNGLSMASGKDIYLGNAYVAGAPTATGYVTIKDSAGTVYKVLVGT